MGRVGSRSILKSLRHKNGLYACHLHWMTPKTYQSRAPVLDETRRRADRYGDYYRLGPMLYEQLIQHRRRLRAITLVRDPIARNISWYFENLPDIWDEPAAYETQTLSRLIEVYLDVFDHEEALSWFDDEIQQAYGIDVYARPFAHDQGWQTYRRGPYELLALRTDLNDQKKAHAIAEYLNLSSVVIPLRNTSAQRPYADVYTEFSRMVRHDESHLDRMYSSLFVQHFFAPEEVVAMRQRWSAPALPSTTRATKL